MASTATERKGRFVEQRCFQAKRFVVPLSAGIDVVCLEDRFFSLGQSFHDFARAAELLWFLGDVEGMIPILAVSSFLATVSDGFMA